MTKQMRGQDRNGEWKRKNKKNEARKKECKRQLERKLRLGTATRPLRRRTKKEKSLEKMVATELLKLAMEMEEERKEGLKTMVANHSAEVSP